MIKSIFAFIPGELCVNRARMPGKIYTNADYCAKFGQIEMRGIAERRRSDLNVIQSSVIAAKYAIAQANIRPDMLISTTIMRHRGQPADCFTIAHQLGINSIKKCVDVDTGCTSAITALELATNALRVGAARCVLYTCATNLAAAFGENSPMGATIGDAAVAICITPCAKWPKFSTQSLLKYNESITFDNNNRVVVNTELASKMNEDIINASVDTIIDVRDSQNMTLCMHQPCSWIGSVIAKRAKMQHWETFAQYGNMGAATCLFNLYDALRNRHKFAQNRAILSSSGAGVSIASANIAFEHDACCDIYAKNEKKIPTISANNKWF